MGRERWDIGKRGGRRKLGAAGKPCGGWTPAISGIWEIWEPGGPDSAEEFWTIGVGGGGGAR